MSGSSHAGRKWRLGLVKEMLEKAIMRPTIKVCIGSPAGDASFSRLHVKKPMAIFYLVGGVKMVNPIFVIICLVARSKKLADNQKKYRVNNREKVLSCGKLYYHKNKEAMSEIHKKYCEEHKEKIALVHKQYLLTHKEQIKGKTREYYDKNKEHIKLYNKRYRENHKEEMRKYRIDNKERIVKRQKEYREANLEKVRLSHRNYEKNNKELVLLSKRNYQEKHKEERTEWKRRRRAAIRNLPVEKFSSLEIYMRDGWICQLCKKKVDKKLKWPHQMSASIDHIVPVSKGGAHLKSNVQLAHLICNMSVGTGGVKQLLMFG